MTPLQAAKKIVDKLMSENRTDDAAFTCCDPNHCATGREFTKINRVPNTSLDHSERSEMDEYMWGKYHINARNQRVEWAKRNEREVGGLRYSVMKGRQEAAKQREK